MLSKGIYLSYCCGEKMCIAWADKNESERLESNTYFQIFFIPY